MNPKPTALLLAVAALSACGGSVEAERAVAPAAPVRQLAQPLPGVRAADGSASFVVRGRELVRVDAVTRAESARFDLGGEWALGGVSATGRWVGLQRSDTEIRVVDTFTGTARDLELAGRFRVGTISKDGSFLFLQQDFVDGTYAVRGYDLGRGRLLPGSLGTKGETLKMQGRAGQVVASPDGTWLLTLYVDTTSQSAFIHALNLVDRIPACIVLPPCDGCDEGELGEWRLELRPDGRTLVASHPRAGRASFDLADY